MRGDRLFIPRTEPETGQGSLRTRAVELAHEGHQGVEKSKKLLRTCVWFPGMDGLVEEKVSGCIACQASVYKPSRDPLCPSKLPERPWQRVSADFWGPLANGEHLLVVIDDYSRYPEVEITSNTSGRATIPLLDKIFATHGIPEVVKTDGGPPFNGHEFAAYARWAGFMHQKTTPEDPEANGLVENFMKSVKKTWHTARVEHKKPQAGVIQAPETVPGDATHQHGQATSGTPIQQNVPCSPTGGSEANTTGDERPWCA